MSETMPAGTTPANARQVNGDHYRRLELQPWDVIVAWNLGFMDGNVIKYVARWKTKDGLVDLKKARHYLDKLIEIEEAKIPTLHERGPQFTMPEG